MPNPVVEEKRQRIILKGDLPDPANPPLGCNFSTRCPLAMDTCYREKPEFIEVEEGHFCACHLVKPFGQTGDRVKLLAA